ncbi:DeoR/GlpR family DNA-binding transcription regulator [Lichenihabitans sp. Uapishka_5]|uniref:DeoR/GlpR family DNA-binding transcription regulator n=1 Tax=Lichenihabitans sp. Uapishka_5 TaxID=3037302 RepID=UPI0029E7D9B5|nr:DeoR/GlpR family DNA-binding transcription regulator [Lichenihabitans sp. Uapishka_5]MDX7951383.1 DeoR/GlpR family DNA-binding transcription regulator [Lichenihabitans sp. Uapishka_5]
MTPKNRREAILDLARHTRELRVDEIAERFGVSRETVRRDLAELDARQLLRRVHGGAEPARAGIEAPFSQRKAENAGAKATIGRVAAALFEQSDAILIDTGSTTEAFATALAARGRFSIITNSSGVAWNLHNAESPSRVYLLGGEFKGDTGGSVGSVTIDQIGRFRADHAVLTIGGIDGVGGCMDFDVEEAMVARAMIAQAKEVTVIADGSKLGRVAMYQVCDLSAVTRLVTDRKPDQALATALHLSGVEVVLAE